MHYKITTCPNKPSFKKVDAPEVTTLSLATTNGYAATKTAANKHPDLKDVKRGTHSNYAAKKLVICAAWSYSDLDTFNDMIMVEGTVGPNVETMMIQVKNEPLIVQATAQMIRTSDKKVAIVVFRGTEMTNLVNWMTDAITKKVDFKYPPGDSRRSDKPKKYVKVHAGFKANFDAVWFGQKGILEHLLHPEMIRKDYAYDKPSTEQVDSSGMPIENEQEELEAIYFCGHSLGGAMAFLAGLYLGTFAEQDEGAIKILFDKLRGVYTYGAPMAVDDHDRSRCQKLCGDVTFRHVYYNDIVPHMPPLSSGSFDHVGAEYRYHPRHGWKKRDEDEFGFKNRSTQVFSIAVTAPVGALDGILDICNWLNFLRGEDRDLPVIGIFSRGYLKMPWSLMDHSPIGYMSSLRMLDDYGSLDAK